MENENDTPKNTGKFLTGIVIVLVLALGLYWYFKKEDKDVRVETTEEAVEVLSQTPQVDIETNPVKNVPDINPVDKTNPFKTTNPFE
ncbi:hypothetical protein A3A05_02110 [Candidatus Nomurabacteria bacterium RIFCSPLOWO2_01_FULL_41_12]|uniref:Uncharacterized protein n=1 Tax=Candidatus Nomurabacteria bacterium RIFCSPLOWO2_01_FULL_41_12 TaxID=1801774 RepID=A0A1F6WW72_9BACT|nr:MAG: hypothetical protein A2732_02110 [Candidatus Nomurabacteria bacterium RIFCSPHIGHO2_01_FULL_40_10]OGI86136.1 MAG: hypothetical protein A3A05_02110 [Candidatus Nomurabacteria bacterium RIFCSPLOWO2_01_FULL_41_12]